MPKVVIVGAGSVGTTLAYTLQITGVATEIVLIDRNHELAEGQARDENSVLTVSVMLNGEYGINGCCLSVPSRSLLEGESQWRTER
jgi:L-lactate dehydrogenase